MSQSKLTQEDLKTIVDVLKDSGYIGLEIRSKHGSIYVEGEVTDCFYDEGIVRVYFKDGMLIEFRPTVVTVFYQTFLHVRIHVDKTTEFVFQ